MRIVDMTKHHVVKCGVTWPYEKTPNCKQMIMQLERNEALVTWLQPNSGGISDQFPVIRIRDHYYTMSLRMMKAVWRCVVAQRAHRCRPAPNPHNRHVRLKKNFVNRETIPHVGVKLRIPEVLLVEKMRTQQRFNVSRPARASRAILISMRAHTRR
jgi:hypothetical protein